MVVVVERILVGLNYSSKIMVKYRLKLLMVMFRYLLNIVICGVYEDANEVDQQWTELPHAEERVVMGLENKR